MTKTLTIHTREEVLTAAKNHLMDKLQQLQSSIASVEEGMANESKSSAGDKFETSREMMRQELDKLSSQAQQLQSHLTTVNSVARSYVPDYIDMGAIAITDAGRYLIADAIGKFAVSSDRFFGLSTAAPIYEQLHQKKAGDTIHMNGRKIKIIKVY